MGVVCSTHGEEEECILGFGGKARRRERPRHRWVDYIKKDLRDRMGWYGLKLSGSGQGPVEGSCEHGYELSGSIKCWEIIE
jgi:hypothetical protein